MDLCSTLRSTLGSPDTLIGDAVNLVPLPGGEADAEAANAMVKAAVNRVAMVLVFISWVVGWGGVPARDGFLTDLEHRLHQVTNRRLPKPLRNSYFFQMNR
jgi:hypothetical protein